MLKRGADRTILNKDNASLLCRVAANGKEEMIEYLIEKYPDLCKHVDKHGVTALHMAAMRGYHAGCRKLLHSGSDISAVDCLGMTALHYAAGCGGLKGHTQVLRVLIEHDADPSTARSDGCTALMECAKIGSTSCVRVLLEACAEVNVSDTDG